MEDLKKYDGVASHLHHIKIGVLYMLRSMGNSLECVECQFA